MTKITKKDFGKKLAKYSALSLAIAGVADATGQVVFTDVDPDFVGGMGSTFAIDFDNDGTDDVRILQSNNGNYELVQASGVNEGNMVAEMDAGNPYTYAQNIAPGALIDSNLLFNSFGSMCAGVGYSGSFFCVGSTNNPDGSDDYVGVQFDISGATHYGYIKVNVADSENFIVEEFAYEITPNLGIEAGAQQTAGVEDQLFEGFSQFVDSNKNLVLNANTPMSNVSVYDILGKVVVSNTLSTSDATVNLGSLNTGIYIARVTIEGQVKSFKIAVK